MFYFYKNKSIAQFEKVCNYVRFEMFLCHLLLYRFVEIPYKMIHILNPICRVILDIGIIFRGPAQKITYI